MRSKFGDKLSGNDRFIFLWHYKTAIVINEGLSMTSGTAARQEPGRYYTFESRLPEGVFFEFRPSHLPRNAKPVTDETSGMCIGYTVAQAPGLWQIYDVQGHFVRLEEAPLETPLFDPTDIALFGLGVFRILRTGRVLFESGARATLSAKISQGTVSLLRGRLKFGLHARSLKMTEAAAKHMYDPARYVPLQIQEKTIRYGKRMPDPREGEGMFRYETDIYKLRFDKHRREYVYQKYRFEVIVRESDWTISHFKYFY